MNDKQNAKLNMAQRVSDTLASHTAVYGGIAPMVAAATKLDMDIADIREVEKEQGAVSISASTQEKRGAESQMIDSCVKVANALYVIGFTTDDKSLTNLLGLSPSSFYREEDNAKLALAQQIFGITQTHAPALAEYGYTPEQIAAIGTAIAAFRNVIAKPMDIIGTRKQKTTNLKQLFATLDSTLYDKLDKLIVLFKDTYPDFYDEYRTARNLINTSVRHRKSAEV
jgi:hypothetical protein